MDGLDPLELARALGEIPLFRELQRLLMSQSGSVNWDIARQVSSAVAGAGPLTQSTPSSLKDQFTEACRVAELKLTELTGLGEPGELIDIHILSRKEWTQLTLNGLKPFIERLASGLGATNPQAQAEGGQAVNLLSALGPLLFGVQVGFMSGNLSHKILGQYDYCYPVGDVSKLYFVAANLQSLQDELGVEPLQFQMWLSLHEVAHRIEFNSIPWIKSHLESLIHRYIDGAEVDAEQMMERLRSLGNQGEIEKLLSRPGDLLPLLATPDQQSTLAEIRAFLSVLEGFAEWAVHSVAPELLPEYDKIREGMNRRRATVSPAEKLLVQLVGLDLNLELYRAGEKLVRSAVGADKLSSLWSGPENLPTVEEVEAPAKWLTRMGY